MRELPDLPVPESVRAVIAQVPRWSDARDIRVSPLQDVISLNNANYQVTVDGTDDYVLRIASDTVRFLGVLREEERESAEAAARAEIGPEVIYFDAQGHMVTPLIRGRHWQPEEFHRSENIERLATTLRQLHAVRNLHADGSVFRRITRLLESARALGLEMPPDLPTHLEELHRVEETRCADSRFRLGLTHNDFWGNNFLDDGQRLWLVDWEFGGNADGLFDLATITLGGRYSEAEQTALLRAYGYEEPGDVRSLDAMKYVVFFFEGAWALVQHGLRGSSGYDFLAHSQRMFQAMRDRR